MSKDLRLYFLSYADIYVGVSTVKNIGDTYDTLGSGAYNYTQNYGANVGF